MRKLLLSIFAVLMLASPAMAQNARVSGTVISDDGLPISGVTVLVQDAGGATLTGTVTDHDGIYLLPSAPVDGTLTFSFLSYNTLTEQINGRTIVDVTLVQSATAIESVMIVAYGITTREAFTGSAGVINNSDIIKRQVSNVTKALSGSVSGVQAYSSSGQPGVAANVRIRGVGSMSSSNTPLYVVDGVPFSGDISSINPADIESMSVLKDASAAAIYGARGANGVILVNTKRGTSREAIITFDAKWGSNKRGVSQYDVMTNTGMYYENLYSAFYNGYSQNPNLSYTPMQMHQLSNNRLYGSDGGTGYPIYTLPADQYLIGTNGKLNPNAILGYNDGYNYYTPDDWYKESFGSGSLRQEYNLSVQGAGEKFNYFFSAGYLNDSGYVPNSGLERITTRVKMDYQPYKWLRISTGLSYTNSDQAYPGSQTTDDNLSSANLFYVSNLIAPVYPMYVRDVDGKVIVDSHGLTVYDFGDGSHSDIAPSRSFMSLANPLAVMALNTRKYEMNIISGRWNVAATIIDGLKASVNIGIDIDDSQYTYRYNKYYGQYAEDGGYATRAAYRTTALNLQYLLTYAKRWGKHNFDVLAGYESYDFRNGNVYGTRYNIYNNDNNELNNAIGEQYAYSEKDKYATLGVLSRAQYDYGNRYFVSASYRRDASSRFHKDNRWGNFGSVGAAWVITNEDFMNVRNIDLLKLKVSWGVQGNDALLYANGYQNYYPYQDQYSLTESGGDFSTFLTYKGNKDITWETSHNVNLGVEFGFFNNRLSGSVEYFNRKTTDLLYNRPMPLSAGYATVPMNVGSIRNTGVEIDLFGVLMDRKNFMWEVNANGTFIKNKVISLAKNEIISGSWRYAPGGSLYNMYLREYAGVDKETGEALYYKVKNNEYVRDTNGKKTTTANWSGTEQKDTGSVMPKFYGGFGTSFYFFGVDVSAQFAFQLGGRVYDNTYQELMSADGGEGTNWHLDILKAWTPENTNTDIPRLNSTDLYGNSTSTRFLTKSNYLSINNITVGYTIPEKFTSRLKIKSIRVYFSGDNLAVFSCRKGLDPRQVLAGGTGSYSYSAVRSISGGLTLTF